MIVIYIQLAGIAIFVLGTLVLGILLRRRPSQVNAERLSRVGHGLFYLGLVIPQAIGVITPGLENYDHLLGMRDLPFALYIQILGGILLLIGLLLVILSSRVLKSEGRGWMAFKLTQQMVTNDLYQNTRNPMSLGYYLSVLGAAMAADSLALVTGVVLLVIPAHVLYLRFFEELELTCRYGDAYREYKARVPFVIPD